jgi:hypothetical protein
VHGWAQRCRDGLDATSASHSSSLFGVVGRARLRTTKNPSSPRASGPIDPASEAGAGEQGPWMVGLLISKQPAEALIIAAAPAGL